MAAWLVCARILFLTQENGKIGNRKTSCCLCFFLFFFQTGDGPSDLCLCPQTASVKER